MDKDLVQVKLELERLSGAVEQQNSLFETHMSDDKSAHANIHKALQELFGQFSKLDKKLDLDIQAINFQLKSINKLDDHQNQLIDEHIEGVNTLKNMYALLKEEHDSRLKALEEPKKFRDHLKKDLKYWLTIAGLVVALVSKISGLW